MTAQTISGWKLVGYWAVVGVLAQAAASAGRFEPGGWLAWINQPSPFWLVVMVGWFLMRVLSPAQLATAQREIAEDTFARLEALSERVTAQQELLEDLREDLGVSPNQKSYRLLCQELLGQVPSYEDFCDPSSDWNQENSRLREAKASQTEPGAPPRTEEGRSVA